MKLQVGPKIDLQDFSTPDCIPNTPRDDGKDLPPGAVIVFPPVNDPHPPPGGGGGGGGNGGNGPYGDGTCDGPKRPDQGEVFVRGEEIQAWNNVLGRGDMATNGLKKVPTPAPSTTQNTEVEIPFSVGVTTINDYPARQLKGRLEITTVTDAASKDNHEITLILPPDSPHTSITTTNGTITEPLGPWEHEGCGIHDFHTMGLNLRVRRLQPGLQTLRIRLIPLKEDGTPITTGGDQGAKKESQIQLEDEVPNTPTLDSYSFTYVESGGTQHRKIGLNGLPLADGKPQAKAESDVEEENTSVDALSLNLSHSTTDVFVPLVGGNLDLAVRRQYVQEIWGTQSTANSPNALSPFSSLERPFGSSWRSGLGANIRIHYPKNDNTAYEPTLVYVMDEQGVTHRFAQTWNPSMVHATNNPEGIAFIPLPSQTTDQDAFMMTLERAPGQGGPQAWTLVFKRKFGTTLYFEPVSLTALTYPTPTTVLSRGAGNMITSTSPGSIIEGVDYYYRLRSATAGPAVVDSSGNELYYTYSAVANFIPSTISPESGANPPRRLVITTGAVTTGAVPDVHAENLYIQSIALHGPEGAAATWSYKYTTSTFSGKGRPDPGKQIMVLLKAVIGPDGNVERAYDYSTVIEPDTAPQPAGKENHYFNCMLTSLIDGAGYSRKISYRPDDTREGYLINSLYNGWQLMQGAPYMVSGVSFHQPVSPASPFNAAGTYSGAVPGAVWVANFTSLTGLSSPGGNALRLLRSANGTTVSGSRMNRVRDATGTDRTWTFRGGKVFGTELFTKIFLKTSSQTIRNPVAQVCWTLMDIDQGTHSSGAGGLRETYEFDPECGMALKRAVDLCNSQADPNQRAEVTWTYGDAFRASYFIPALAATLQSDPTKRIDQTAFFPQRYSDPTMQTRILKSSRTGNKTNLIKTFTYYSSGSTDPNVHKTAWARSLKSTVDENNITTAYELDTAKGWLVSESVYPGTSTGNIKRKIEYGYGNLGSAAPSGTARAFVGKTTVKNGTGSAGSPVDLVTVRGCDSYGRMSSETIGYLAGPNLSTITYFKYDSRGRLVNQADGRAAPGSPFIGPYASSFSYTPSGRLSSVSWTAPSSTYVKNPGDGVAGKEISYDLAGRVAWEKDERGTKTGYVYTYGGTLMAFPEVYSVQKWIDLNGNGVYDKGMDPTETTFYDAVGKIREHVVGDPSDPAHTRVITENYYNSLGLLIETRVRDLAAGGSASPEYTVTQFEYDFNDNYSGGSLFDTSAIKPSKITGPFRFGSDDTSRGAVIWNTYDSCGRKIQEIANYSMTNSSTTTYGYDGVGNQISVGIQDFITPSNTTPFTTTTQYDALNRPELVTKPDGSTIQTTYSPAGLVLKTKYSVSLGSTDFRETATSYDLAGRKAYEFPVDLSTGAASGLWAARFIYHDSGQVKDVERKRDILASGTDVTSYDYDARGRLSLETLPSVTNTTSTSVTRGVRKFFYDAKGNRTKVLDSRADFTVTPAIPDDFASLTQYDRADRPVRVFSCPVAVFGITGQKRLLTETTYDIGGNAVEVKSGQLASVSFDAPTGVYSYALDGASSGAYSLVTNVYSNRGFLLATTSYPKRLGDSGYDSSVPQTTSFTYDSVGNKTSVTDPMGKRTVFTYDPLGRVLETRHLDSYLSGSARETTRNVYLHGVLKETHELARSPSTVTRSKIFSHNKLGQITGVIFPSYTSYNEIRNYNLYGELLSVICSGAPARSIAYTYDRRGRVKTESSLGKVHSHTYDDSGNRLTSTFDGPVPLTVTSTYNGLNNLVTMSEGNPARVTTYKYDIAGNLTAKVLPNSVTEGKDFDAAGRVTALRHTQPDIMVNVDLTTYAYNSLSSVVSVTETYPATNAQSGNNAAPRIVTNIYDRAQRLTKESISVSGGTPTVTDFTYDKGDNRTIRTSSISGVAISGETYDSGEGQVDFNHNGSLGDDPRLYTGNQLRSMTRTGPVNVSGIKVAYLYDDYGNRTARREYGVAGASGNPPNMTVGKETRYFWDHQNKLIKVERQDLARTGTGGAGGTGTWNLSGSVTTWEFDYDYRGRRVIRNGPDAADAEIFIYSGGTSVHQASVTDTPTSISLWRSNPSGQTAAAAGTLSYVRGSDMGGGVGGILYSLTNGGTPLFQQHNQRGDVTAYTDAAGVFTFQSSYEAFGKHVDFGTAPVRRTQRASSKEEDSVLGLLNEGFRYRDMEAGGFLSRDPAGFVDGPNLYTYVLQNPWTTFDPLGLHDKRKILKALVKLGKNNVDEAVTGYKRGKDAVKAVVKKAAGKDGRAKINGIDVRMPLNHKPGEEYLIPGVGKKVYYDANGFPKFDRYVPEIGGKRMEVKIKMTGDDAEDFKRAREALGLTNDPGRKGEFTWHHHEDGETMQLVPYEIHSNAPHTGGAKIIRDANGGESIFEQAAKLPGVAEELVSALAPKTVAAFSTGAGAVEIAKSAAKDAIDSATDNALMLPRAGADVLGAGMQMWEDALDSRIEAQYKSLGLTYP